MTSSDPSDPRGFSSVHHEDPRERGRDHHWAPRSGVGPRGHHTPRADHSSHGEHRGSRYPAPKTNRVNRGDRHRLLLSPSPSDPLQDQEPRRSHQSSSMSNHLVHRPDPSTFRDDSTQGPRSHTSYSQRASSDYHNDRRVARYSDPRGSRLHVRPPQSPESDDRGRMERASRGVEAPAESQVTRSPGLPPDEADPLTYHLATRRPGTIDTELSNPDYELTQDSILGVLMRPIQGRSLSLDDICHVMRDQIDNDRSSGRSSKCTIIVPSRCQIIRCGNRERRESRKPLKNSTQFSIVFAPERDLKGNLRHLRPPNEEGCDDSVEDRIGHIFRRLLGAASGAHLTIVGSSGIRFHDEQGARRQPVKTVDRYFRNKGGQNLPVPETAGSMNYTDWLKNTIPDSATHDVPVGTAPSRLIEEGDLGTPMARAQRWTSRSSESGRALERG